MQKVQMTYTQDCKREAVRLAQTCGKQITQVSRELGISDKRVHQWRKELADHEYFSFPKSINLCCTRKRCTATHTATPTNISDKTEHSTNRTEVIPAQKGQGRTPANNICRVPPSNSPFHSPFCSVQVTHPSSYPSLPDQCKVQYAYIFINWRLGIFGDCF